MFEMIKNFALSGIGHFIFIDSKISQKDIENYVHQFNSEIKVNNFLLILFNVHHLLIYLFTY